MGKIESALTENDAWGTPGYLLDAITRVLGPIGLDPCSHPDAVVPCTTAVLLPGYAPRTNPYAQRTVYANGLEIVWKGHGTVYVNSPYSEPLLRLFLEKCATDGDEVVALVPVRTGNVYWPKAAGKADVEVRLPRVTFRGGKPLPPGKKYPHAPFHSWLLWWGDRVETALGLGVLGEVRVHPRHSLFRPTPARRRP